MGLLSYSSALLQRKFSLQYDLRRRTAYQDRKITWFGLPGARAYVVVRKCTMIQADGYAFSFPGLELEKRRTLWNRAIFWTFSLSCNAFSSRARRFANQE